MSARALPPIAIVGSGRLGRALALELARGGCGAVTLVARSAASRRDAQRLLAEVRRRGRSDAASPALTTDLEGAVRAARWLLLALPDRALGAFAQELAARGLPGWRGRVVLHHAGALGPAPLAPLAALGAQVGVLHPLAALPHAPARALGAFEAVAARIEGSPAAVRAAGRLASILGLRRLTLRARLTDDERALYHAAAALVSNDLMALLGFASDLLVAIGARRHDAEAGLARLAGTAAANVCGDGSLAAGLTGPVVRGDAGTLARHLRALRGRSRDAAAAHRLLSLRLVELAERSGRLDAAGAAALRRSLPAGRTGKVTV